MPKRPYPFESLFRRLVPDLTTPDSDGWSSGTCPYCGDRNSFRANLLTGKWVCLPAPQGMAGPTAARSAKEG